MVRVIQCNTLQPFDLFYIILLSSYLSSFSNLGYFMPNIGTNLDIIMFDFVTKHPSHAKSLVLDSIWSCAKFSSNESMKG